jgi:hypothetical protein
MGFEPATRARLTRLRITAQRRQYQLDHFDAALYGCRLTVLLCAAVPSKAADVRGSHSAHRNAQNHQVNLDRGELAD